MASKIYEITKQQQKLNYFSSSSMLQPSRQLSLSLDDSTHLLELLSLNERQSNTAKTFVHTSCLILANGQSHYKYLRVSAVLFSSSIASSSASEILRVIQADFQLISALAITTKWMSSIFSSNVRWLCGGMVASIWSKETFRMDSITVHAFTRTSGLLRRPGSATEGRS